MKDRKRIALPALALSGISAAMLSAPSQAVTFGSGDFKGQFNSTWTLGASWRMEGRDGDLVSPGNTNRPQNEGASSSVTDDGNLNFDQGDMYSLVFKGLHDLDLSYKNFGVFTRFKYWYDYELERGNQRHGNSVNGYEADAALKDDGFNNLSKFSGIALLDAYVYTNFNAGSVPIDLRLGRQVVNWGESTFIQGGINAINPVDVSALRRPGSELKEALLPVGMFFGSFGLTNSLTLEAYYQFEWERFLPEGCGTYWSTADPAPEGCDDLTILNSVPDQQQLGNIDIDSPLGALSVPGSLKRGDDEEGRNGQQYGISLKYFAESLGSTEFGLYYVKYDSRVPMLGSVIGDLSGLGVPILSAQNSNYILQFPEGIDLYGLSFNTNIAGWSLGGEFSYRPNLPLDINTTETLQAAAFGAGAPWSTQQARALEVGTGGTLNGYDRVKYSQLQFTTIRSWYAVMGAARFSIVGEIGGNYIDGMESGQRYGRSPTYGIGEFTPFSTDTPVLGGDFTCQSGPVINPNNVSSNCTDDGYITNFAWGYRLRAVWNYDSAIAGINLSPQFAWSHDVQGYSPLPSGFNEGAKAAGFALNGDYLSRYSFGISYNVLFDGDYNVLQDRDFLSMNVGMAF